MSHPFFGPDDPTHPFFDDDTDDLRLGTARGREASKQENIAENIAKLEGLIEAATDPKRKAHLQTLITNLEKQRTGWTRPKDNDRGGKTPYRGFGTAAVMSRVAEKYGEDLVRGAATGVATAAPLAADLALVIPDLAGVDKAAQMRRSLQENVAVTRETLDPQGGAGLIGEFGGGIVAGAPVYGPVANASARVISKAPLVGKALQPLLTGQVGKGVVGKIGASAVGNAIAGLPLNFLQAMGIEGSIQDKARVFGMGVGADLLFGGASRQPAFRERPKVKVDVPADSPIPPREVPLEAPTEGAATPPPRNADGDLAGLNAKAARDKQRSEVRKQWQTSNPDKKWSELTQQEKAAVYRGALGRTAPATPAETGPSIPAANAEQLTAAKAELARARAAAATGDQQAATLVTALEGIISRSEPKAAPAAKPPGPRARGRRQADGAPATEKRASFQEAEAREQGKATNPVVLEYILKKDLEKKFTEAGLPFDRSKSAVDLQVELSTHLEGNRTDFTTEQLQEVVNDLKARGNNDDTVLEIISNLEAQIATRQATPAPEPPTASGVAQPSTSGRSAIVGQPGATNGAPGGVSPAAIDPIQARLEALKRGESITPSNRPTQAEDFDDIVNRVVDSVPPRGALDGVEEARARYKAFQDVKGFTAATAEKAELSPKVFDRVRELETAVLKDVKEFGYHVTDNPSDVPSRSGAHSIEFRAKIDKDRQFVEARTKSEQDTIMAGWSEPEFLDNVRHVFGGKKEHLYAMYEMQAVALLREARRRGIKIVEKPVIDYEDGKRITRPMKTEADLRAEDLAYDVERIEPQGSSSGKATKPADASPRPTASPAVAPLNPAPTGISPDLPAVSVPRTDLSKRTMGQLNKMDEKLLKELESLNPRSPEYATKVQEMQEVTAELNRREELEANETVEIPSPAEAPRPHAGLPAEQLLDLRDALQEQTVGHKTVPPDLRTALELVNAEINGRKTGIFNGPDESIIQPETPQPRVEVEPQGESALEPPPLDPKKFRATPSRLSTEDIDAQIERLSFDIGQGTKTVEVATKKGSRKATVGENDIDKIRVYQERLAALMTERAKRSAPPPKGPDGAPPPTGMGLKLQSNPSVGAFLGGYTYGWLFVDDDTTLAEKNSRAFMWGMVAAGSVGGANYMRARQRALTFDRVSLMLPNRNQFPQAVYSMDDLQRPNRPFMARMRDFYRGVYRKAVQGTEGIETLTENMGRKEESAERSAYKLASMFGTWISRNEAFNTSRLTYVENGEPHLITNQTFTDLGLEVDPETGPKPLPLSEILGMADSDKRALGDLAVAYASAEGAGRGPVPMDIAHREALIRGAHPQLRLAVKELRKYNLSLLITMYKGGRLSLEGLQAAGAENWYTPLQRIVAAVDRLNMRTGSNKINAPNPLLGRKGGSSQAVLNPYEATVDLTRRMLRAVEYGQVTESLVSLIETLPKDQQLEILKPLMPSANPKVAALNTVMGSSDMKQFQSMTNMSDADVKSLLAYIDDETTNNAGQFSLFRNGEIHTYQLTRPDIFESLKSLTPIEIDMFIRFMGAPTRVAARGTVLNPIFALNQIWMDNLSVALNSKYGMIPGWDTFAGWYHAMTNSPKYQKLIDVGGPGSITQLDYTNPEAAMQASRLKGVDAIDTAVKSVKEWAPVRAYKAFLYPILDAPRVAEYLAALRNGATTLEAAYAAHDVGGNLRMQGSLQGVRIFHHLTLFSRPAVAAMAKAVKEVGVGMHAPEYNKTTVGRTMQKAGVPRRAAGAMSFMARGFAYLAVPTMGLWWLNKDDEEIKQLRKTTGGQRYWFVRDPSGDIVKLRKPHVIGQIFGTAVENWLDSAEEENPEALATWLSTMASDASVNMLPQIGVVPYSLWANKSLGLNSPLVPRREDQLNPMLQGYDRASMPARIIAEELEPLSSNLGGEGVLATALRRGMSPAGIGYIIGQIGGMSGQDAVRLAGSGIEYARSGFPPPKEELPFIGRLFAAYPSMNVHEVQTFYNHDSKVMEVVKTLDWWEKRDPSKLPDYINENLHILTMAAEHQDARQHIADMRRAIDDMRRMPEGTVSRQAQKKTEAHFVKLIEDRLRITNDIWRNVMAAHDK